MTVVCKSAIVHLRYISRIRRYLIAAAIEQVIHAFVTHTHRLDVGNALLYRLHASQANTTASESAELGSPHDRRRYSAADKVALAANSSASGIQNPATHSSSSDWPCTWMH